MNNKTMSDAIKEELTKLRDSGKTCKEIAQISSVQVSKVWRVINLFHPIDLNCIDKLERAGLINPMAAIMRTQQA